MTAFFRHSDYYVIDTDDALQRHIRIERDRARKLRKSRWWQTMMQRGECHYCHRRVDPAQLTMDHVVPLARGGRSTKGNVVPACPECNRAKRLETPAEARLNRMPRPEESC
ncbi:MAG: HNH endonuclease [Nitrospirae bacterium]|nr:MAG: HNH endonuclease [Nitrospirota bacterium]